MTRSPWHSRLASCLLAAGLVLGSAELASAQPSTRDSLQSGTSTSSSAWPWVLGILIGVGLGVLGAKMLGKKERPEAFVPVPEPSPEPPVRAPAQNVRKENKPMAPVPSAGSRPVGKGGRPLESEEERRVRKEMEAKPYQPVRSSATPEPRPKAENRNKPAAKPAKSPPPKPANNTPMQPTATDPGNDQPLQPGQTIELSPKPTIQELIDTTAPDVPIDRDARVESLEALEAAAASAPSAPTGPVHYYAPAPDVPSIEHRKLSPNPLPQMPLLITLAQADAETAQFSFSPQADQSRIIGNGVRELKEFFQFELPPTEQFTTIQNLVPGKLEKRDDTWHVVQKAGIALS